MTLDINGVIDTGLAIERDFNGFLRVVRCNDAQTRQRRGRAGRVRPSMYKQLRPKGFPESSAQATYCMPKAEQLSVVFAAVCLGKDFPIIGITAADAAERYSELIELAVIAPKAIWPSSAAAHRLTDFGTDVRRCPLDFSIGILEAFCARFDLSWHGKIAAAYIAAQRDIYVRHNIGSATVGLYPEQLDQAVVVPAVDDVRTSQNAAGDDADDNADGETDPDLHTAVKVYLQYIVAGNVDENIFNLNCIAKMHYHLEKARERYVTNGCHQLTAATAQSLLQAPAWDNVLS